MRSRAVIRADALSRKIILRYLCRKLPVILLTEYPKSGASWLGQMLSELTGYDFPRQEFPRLTKTILHGHYLDGGYNCKTIVFWRDPRDIMVSWYYHTLHLSDKNHPKFVANHRKKLAFRDYDDIRGNLPGFIEFVFENPLSPKFNFNDFVDCWWGRNDVIHCKYEELSIDPVGKLIEIVGSLGLEESTYESHSAVVDKYSFSRQAHRSKGVEDKSSYLRKGIVGDWVNHFSSESKSIFSHYIGDRLIKLGYEDDDSWCR